MKLIESDKFIESDIIEKINAASAKEKSGGSRPPYWEMVFWWTRKPLIGARSVIAASLLPEDISIETFKRIVRLNAKRTPHRENPETDDYEDYFKGKKLLDPFAGFGSIPLEAQRLGLDVTAVELLPTAYIFLKAVLEYPAKYGKKLIDDVKYWGEWGTEQLRADEEIKELYDDDVAVNIGTWEVKCPHCAKWTPLVGNWWLARVKDTKGYKRLAYMKPVRNSNSVDIEVFDVPGDVSKAVVDTRTGKVEVGERIYEVPKPNLNARRQQATCLNCSNLIRLVDGDGNHFMDGKNLEWYVKWALKKYHEGDERFARQRLLVKVKGNKDLVFEPCDEEDNKKLEWAKEKVKELIARGDSDIPNEPISYYSVRYLFPILYGMSEWYKLFNPRQLLTLLKLVKLIRVAGKRIEREKIKEEMSEEDALIYAEAVTTYLTIALVNFARHCSVVNLWDSTSWQPVKHVLSMRGIAMQWNWCDNTPYHKTSPVSYQYFNNKNVKGVQYLTSAPNPAQIQQKFEKEQSRSKTKTTLEDATALTKLNETFDVIVTDPPYADDVPYTELSDFYYVWLKRALSDSDGVKSTPRFHADAFFKRIGAKVVETKTQWQTLARREISTNPGRFMDVPDRNEVAATHFQELLTQAFIVMREKLDDEGVLVTYYAHTSPEAWANLLEAAWQGANFTVKNAFPLATESKQRVTARGKLALDTSIVVVWRKGGQ
jgi:putative DNA methylase